MKADGNNMPAKKVLIVDDDSRNIFALKAVLKSKGFDCVAATSGREGLKLLSEQKDIGIVLLDMMMPEMDGYETIAEIRKSGQKEVPIVSVTALAMVGDREKCIDAGADAYVSKPIDIDHLTDLLKHYLQ
jgi:CheY-like chemotaxis protein